MDISEPSLFSPSESSSNFIHSTNALNLEFDNRYLTKEIVFLDTSADNYLELAKELKADETILLQSNEDGIEQITAALARYHNLSSIKIVSHGSSGNLQLGASQLNADDLINYAGVIQSWGNALSADADILLYGCNIASGVAGVSFVNRFAELTGADLAASDDLTGHASLGGDWTLEVTTGAIESDSAISSKTMEEYESILPIYNNNEYVLTSTSLSWTQAQAEARSRGGNLVTINNAAEETWLKTTFGSTQSLWIGINDAAVEGQFRWANGEPVTYTNWAPGEPNNLNGNQDFGWMNYGTSRQWDDASSTTKLRGIIEIPAPSSAGAINLTRSNFTVNENNNVTIAVQRTGGSEGTVTVGYRTSNGTAIAGSDYTAATGTLTFGQGETSKTVTLSVLENATPESNETFNFTLENVTGGATIPSPNRATITIVDNDSLSYRGNQYFFTSGALTWQQAQTEAKNRGGNLVTINTAAEETWLKQNFGSTEGFLIGINDATVEGQFRWASDEPVTYTNWAPGQPSNSGGNQDFGSMNSGTSRQWDDLGPTTRLRGIIEVNTGPGSIRLRDSNYRVNEGSNTATVTIERIGGSSGVVTVDYRTVDSDDATAGLDYTAITTSTVTFDAGETVKTVDIAIADDDLLEGDERFGFAIDNPTGDAILLAPRTAQIAIVDNDRPSNIFTYNGNQYFFTSGALTWQQAQAEAQSQNGNLVSINDFAEEAWLKQTFGDTETLWTGINDSDVEGQFVWASGQTVTYTNWAPDEPSNASSDRDFGAMNYGLSRQWNDNNPNELFRGIIEIGDANPNPADPPTLATTTVVSGLSQPIAIDWVPDDGTMFIAQKSGIVRVFRNGTLQTTPLIDIRSQVNNVADRGLLDIAVHPQFQTNPYVYLLFTYDAPQTAQNTGLAGPDGRGNRMGRLIRVTVNTTTWTADPNSQVVLLGNNGTWNVDYNPFIDSTLTSNFNAPPAGISNGQNLQDFLAADSNSHTVGSVEFGSDGWLYVSNGDGTSYNAMDPRTVRVQDTNNLSGKILRIDPMMGQGISSNPFYDGDPNSNRSKVYQYGLRNPFRFTLDPNNRLFVGDVGWTRWEEINSAGPGANFGWPYYEGGNGQNLRASEYQNLPQAQAFYGTGTATPAIYALNHNTGINAIVMGDVYTGTLYPEKYRGDLFFNDLGQGIVRNISFDEQGRITSVETFATGANIVVQIATGPDGKLYYVDLNDGLVGAWQFV